MPLEGDVRLHIINYFDTNCHTVAKFHIMQLTELTLLAINLVNNMSYII